MQLTGDQLLRRVASEIEVEVHGVLWLKIGYTRLATAHSTWLSTRWKRGAPAGPFSCRTTRSTPACARCDG